MRQKWKVILLLISIVCVFGATSASAGDLPTWELTKQVSVADLDDFYDEITLNGPGLVDYLITFSANFDVENLSIVDPALGLGTNGAFPMDLPVGSLLEILLPDIQIGGTGGFTPPFTNTAIATFNQNGEILTAEASATVNVVPEPATLFLVGAGLAGLAGFRRKFFKK